MKKIGILIGIMIIGMLMLTGCTEYTSSNYVSSNTENIANECEHDWVVTSEYSWIFECYRTVTKCSKCEKTIR